LPYLGWSYFMSCTGRSASFAQLTGLRLFVRLGTADFKSVIASETHLAPLLTRSMSRYSSKHTEPMGDACDGISASMQWVQYLEKVPGLPIKWT
jgi:hypothetical protein